MTHADHGYHAHRNLGASPTLLWADLNPNQTGTDQTGVGASAAHFETRALSPRIATADLDDSRSGVEILESCLHFIHCLRRHPDFPSNLRPCRDGVLDLADALFGI